MNSQCNTVRNTARSISNSNFRLANNSWKITGKSRPLQSHSKIRAEPIVAQHEHRLQLYRTETSKAFSKNLASERMGVSTLTFA